MSNNNYRIFIADDHPVIIEGLKFLFQDNHDFELVGTAGTRDELFNKLDFVKADLVIFDLKMPGLNWYSAVKRLLVHHPKMKCLVFSAYDQPEILRSLKELGVHGFASKLSDIALLPAMIYKILDGEFIYKPKKINGKDGNPQDENDLSGFDPFDSGLKLTKRERNILILLGRGLTNKKIAEQLYLSKYTVDTHREDIMHKLNLDNSAELLRFAIENGFV